MIRFLLVLVITLGCCGKLDAQASIFVNNADGVVHNNGLASQYDRWPGVRVTLSNMLVTVPMDVMYTYRVRMRYATMWTYNYETGQNEVLQWSEWFTLELHVATVATETIDLRAFSLDPTGGNIPRDCPKGDMRIVDHFGPIHCAPAEFLLQERQSDWDGVQWVHGVYADKDTYAETLHAL